MWVPVDDLFAILRNQLLIATAVPCASSLGNLSATQACRIVQPNPPQRSNETHSRITNFG